MLKIVLKRIMTYLLYLCFSLGVGYLSLLGKTDYVDKLSGSIIPILLTLMVLYSAISGQLIARLTSINLDKDALIKIIDAMERNVVIEVILLLLTFAFLSSFSWLTDLTKNRDCLNLFLRLSKNAMVCFDFLYFTYVVYDSTVGLYHLLKKSV